jgi:Fuc2NAc and GlcNAc transferase
MIPYLLIAVFAISFFITGAIRRYALARQLMDIPNARSSHSVPTPRGGGVGFVVAFLLALPILVWMGAVDVRGALALGIPGLMVAVLGFIDDHGHVAARWRLLGHFAASVIGLWLLNGLPPVEVAGRVLDLGWVGNVLAVFYLVWMLNLFNFMDGIDGLAASEAVFVLGGLCLIQYLLGAHDGELLPAVGGISVIAFLLWNLPPARIFMGDAGSGFLGLTIALVTIFSTQHNPKTLWAILILSGFFVIDATLTLLSRLLQGKTLYTAHSTHAYQHSARRLNGHLRVVVCVMALNFLFLLPLALAVALGKVDPLAGVILSYVPLAVLVLFLGAGREGPSNW